MVGGGGESECQTSPRETNETGRKAGHNDVKLVIPDDGDRRNTEMRPCQPSVSAVADRQYGAPSLPLRRSHPQPQPKAVCQVTPRVLCAVGRDRGRLGRLRWQSCMTR